jgi:hypothetical protein
MWYKFRSNEAAMYGQWQYTKIPQWVIDEDYDIGDYLKDLGYGDEWSEHWRGFDWEPIDKPPKEFVEKELKEVTIRRDGLNTYIEELEGLLNE